MQEGLLLCSLKLRETVRGKLTFGGQKNDEKLKILESLKISSRSSSRWFLGFLELI